MAKQRGKQLKRQRDSGPPQEDVTSVKGKPSNKKQRTDNGKANQAAESDDKSLFAQMTKTAGFLLMNGSHANQLSVNEVIFQQRLRRAFGSQLNTQETITEFISGLQSHIEDPDRFKSCLLPTVTPADCQSTRGSSQESLIKLLLGIDDVQPALINVLLEKLPEFMEDGDDMFDCGDTAQLPKLILNQFHMMDNIVNSKEMTDKMLEMIGISSPSIQREIIACISDVVSDQDHDEVATRLKNILECETQLMVPVIDALDNLNLSSGLTEEVRTSALQNIESADLDDLPVVIKFILQSVTSNIALEVVSELRRNLDFGSCQDHSTGAKRAGSSGNKKRGDGELLILDTIKSALRFNRVLADNWLKAIEKVSDTAGHKVLDILILLMTHASNHTKKQVETIFRQKIRRGHFSKELLQATFTSHPQVLRDHLPALLGIAEKMLRSSEQQVCQFGVAIYTKAFLAFDMHCRQEIISALVTHIGSSHPAEIDCALDILSSLATTHANDLAPFAIFVKGVLDYLDNLTMGQVKKLFFVLSALAYKGSGTVSTLQDELHIIVRKNLTSNSLKYRRVGVVASLMVLQNIAANRSESGSVAPMSQDAFRQVLGLLDLVKTSSKKSPDAAALFFDELANIVQMRKLHPKLLETIGESVMDEFQHDFIVDVGPDTSSSPCGLPMGELYSLEGDESQGSVAINLLPLVCKAAKDKAKSDAKTSASTQSKERFGVATCLAPHFRLLRVCEQAQHEGSLEGIDALLGCPLYSSKEEVVEEVHSLSQQDKELLCTNLLMCLNWFREAINGFATLQDPEMRGKVLGRLQQITHLQTLIDACIEATPGFVPPPANFDCEQPVGTGHKAQKTSKKDSKKSKKKAVEVDTSPDKADLTVYDYTTQGDKENSGPSEKDQKQGTTEAGLDWDKSRVLFRELDFEVFSVLGCGLVSKAILDSEMNTKEVHVLQLQPSELRFLLTDLKGKLDHALPALQTRNVFLKTKWDKDVGFSHLNQFSSRQIAKKTVKMLPSLCQHLETTSGFFQAMLAQNDGLLDGPGWNSEEAIIMGQCLHLLLQALLTLFSWCGFSSSENQSVLEEALGTLSSRIADAGKTSFTFSQILKNAFQYIENFSGLVPSLAAGVTVLQLLTILHSREKTPASAKKIACQAESLLKRDWLASHSNRDKGGKYSELLQSVIEMYLHHSEDAVRAIETLCTDAIPEIIGGDKNTASAIFPTLNRTSLTSYYHVMLKELVTYSQGLHLPSKPSHDDQLRAFERWKGAVRVFGCLVNLLKSFDLRANLKSLLKYGRIFLDIFLRDGMLLMDQLFKSQKDDVQVFLKMLQQCTRSLQHVCSHTKVAKDISLTSYVPQMKRLLEQFVYRVKVMLTLNNCHEAFWVGNLKNRDLRGDEIPSQMSQAEPEESEDEDGDDETEDGNRPPPTDASDEEDEDEGEKVQDNSDQELSCSESF